MKTKLTALAVSIALLMPTLTQAQSRFDELANLPFEENRPTKETAQKLQDELRFQRATPNISTPTPTPPAI